MREDRRKRVGLTAGNCPSSSGREGAHGRRLILKYFEDVQQLRHFQEVSYSLIRVQELHGASSISQGCMGGDQFSQSGTVDVGTLAKVDQELFAPFRNTPQ